MDNRHGNMLVDRGDCLICICNKGMAMKRRKGSQRGDQRKLIKFNWMFSFTHSNVCLSNFTEIKTKTKIGARRIRGENDGL